jgi:predicted nucleotidyltransferase
MSLSREKLVEQAAQALREQLGENLHSCCLYGSAVRGNFIEGQSDINLLIVLGVSNPSAHEAIAKAIGVETVIDPFIIGHAALARSVRAFASKFVSIKRNYRVIYGADPLADLQIDPAQERFLCEQAMRNLQLRMTYAFVTRERNHSYRRFLIRSVTPVFVQLSEVLRLGGITIPNDFDARIAIFEEQFKINGNALRELLRLKTAPGQQSKGSDQYWHEQLFPIVDSVVGWVDSHWRDK